MQGTGLTSFPSAYSTTTRSHDSVSASQITYNVTPMGSVSSSIINNTCVNVGNVTLNLHGKIIAGVHYACGGNLDPATDTFGVSAHSVGGAVKSSPYSGSDPSSNFDYEIGWSSGSCSGCADTAVTIDTALIPNTRSFGFQDNVYSNQGTCGDAIVLQSVLVMGTSSNGYSNVWGIEPFNYNQNQQCTLSTTTVNNNIMTGINLANANRQFEMWYVIGSGGYPTTADLLIYTDNQGDFNLFTQNIPGGYTNQVDGWELVVVCSSNGCNTNFSSGSGAIVYYQNNI